MMIVLLEEEYGFRYWLFLPDLPSGEINDTTNMESMVVKIQSEINQAHFWANDSIIEKLAGEWMEITYEVFIDIRKHRNFDVVGHLHDEHDSWVALEKDAHFRNPYTGEDFPDEVSKKGGCDTHDMGQD
ncbi:hypothetical protein CL634_01090 [bacterium]|nr:hypothetical protein [bacterium]|tara:strand:+ start:8896 stop:9282 length:387 start_codon:yes stop_codon:yes gene_type:complete